MDIINMSSKQITSNITLDSYNTSGYLKIVNYFNRKMVIKKIDPIRCDEVISKVLFLNRYKNLMPSNFVIPEFLVLLDNKDLYMAIDYINGNNLGDVLKDKNINIRDKKIYLSYIGNTLEEMRHMRENPLLSDFCLGDLHEDNFIVSNKKLYTIDLDEAKIDSISPIVSYLQVGSLFSYLHTDKYIIEDYNPYFVKYKVDYNTDMYCYIMVILNFLYGDNVNNMNINDFYSKLGLEYSDSFDVLVLKRSSTNRIITISVNGKEFSARTLYDKLSLKSTDFSLKRDGDKVIIDTIGYGHGVGMSQYGAKGMAEEGYNYKEILSYYYSGTSIKKIKNFGI